MMNHNQDYILEQCSFSANRDKEGDEEWVLPRKEEGDAMSTEGMDAADVADIEPMANPQDAMQRLRDDVVTEVDQREKFQAIAPNTEAGLYLVPKVLE